MATTAGKAAVQVVRGAEADVKSIKLAEGSKLASYNTLQLGEVTTDVPPICTAEAMGKVREGLREGLASDTVKKAFPGGGKKLKINVVCRFCKGKGVIGGEGRLDWLVTLADGESGEELGVVHVEGVSESPLQHGISDMAEENLKELAKFVTKHKKKAG
ncbi:MAG: hypothetical protein HY718_00675 [Planctomycetes bacterium]|nr:hypothetical protein [Planctomycetota bacterium]